MSEIGEKCAVVGVWSKSKNVSKKIYFGLFSLQHRGQEQSGIVVYNKKTKKNSRHVASGLVSQIYSEKILNNLKGSCGIGHNRYSTSKGVSLKNAQPFVFGDLALAHNGNLPSTKKLEEYLKIKENKKDTASDSQLMALALKKVLKGDMDILKAIEKVYELYTGAFSLVIMYKNNLIGVRDRFGVRPLSLGKTSDGQFVLASETCAFNTTGAEFVRDIKPGEIFLIDQHGKTKSKMMGNEAGKIDSFEFVYFARHDSVICGRSVYEARVNSGIQLAKEVKAKNNSGADVVIPIPETSIPAAIGFARESKIPYEMALHKNRYIHRTFIQPDQTKREGLVKMKFSPIVESIKGKKIILIDDSLVRGTTSKNLIKYMFELGAKEVHFFLVSPKVIFPDFYGIDTPDQKKLFASQKNKHDMCKELGATSLEFLSIEGLVKAIGLPKENLNLSCFNGVYPIDILERSSEVNYNIPKD